MLDIISYNCKGFKERNYDYIKNLFNKCDVLMLQETWLYKFQESNIKNLFVDSNCFSVSSLQDDDVGRQGRPLGGLH